jgi:hypothetical protein
MNIKKAIQRYEKNIRLAMDGEKDFSFRTCRQKCGCLVGIRFDDVALEYGQLRCVRNGYRFKTSMDLGNRLEFMYYPLIRNRESLMLKRERDSALGKIIE